MFVSNNTIIPQAGVPMHSTTAFSMNGKEGRGDTSAWTDSPLDRAQKAQQKYDSASVVFPL
jgi:hypothetical protein